MELVIVVGIIVAVAYFARFRCPHRGLKPHVFTKWHRGTYNDADVDYHYRTCIHCNLRKYKDAF